MNALLVHGAGGGGWEWQIWRRVFIAQGFRVSAPDLQPVSAGLEATTLQDYAVQVREAVLALPSPRVLVGASLGGLLVAMNAGLADALILINPLPPAPWHSRLPVRAPYPARIPWRSGASLAGTRRSLFDADEAACLFAFRNWRDESGAVMNAALAGIAIEKPSCPVGIIVSGRDEDVPAELSRELAQAFAATTIFLPEASHVGPLLGRQAADAAQQTVGLLNECIQRRSN